MIPYRKIPVSISESEELSMLRARAPTWSCKKLLARYIEACKYMNGETSGYSHPLTSEQKDQLQLRPEERLLSVSRHCAHFSCVI